MRAAAADPVAVRAAAADRVAVVQAAGVAAVEQVKFTYAFTLYARDTLLEGLGRYSTKRMLGRAALER